MLRITKLVLRGFKSFKKVDIHFNCNYMAIAGPNGSGKSNIADALRFVFGEMSLRSIRARKIRDLININSSKASVTVYLSVEDSEGKLIETIEIRRAIREDGKMLYRYNGDRTTRSQVRDLLAKHGFTLGAHNVIAQGKVQRLIDMNARERRELIEEVAGIAEYEKKKEEAMGELAKVEQKISEANVLLGEREGYLKELEKEKIAAERYLEFSKRMKDARATLLKREVTVLETNFEKNCTELAKLQQADGEAKKEIADIEEIIKGLEAEKTKLVDKLNAWSLRDKDARQLGEMRSKAETCGVLLAEKEKELTELDARIKSLTGAGTELDVQAAQAGADYSSTRAKFEQLKLTMRGASGEAAKLLIDRKIALEVDKGRHEEIISRGGEALEGSGAGGHEGKRKEFEGMKRDIIDVDKQLDDMFRQEREYAKQIPEIEKKMLSIREKLANASYPEVFKVIDELKQSNNGIYGRIAELIEFEGNYLNAIDAALGNRLNYIVVDDVDTAQETIGTIKKRCTGRVTFIPLSDISSRAGASGGSGLNPELKGSRKLIDLISFEKKYQKAMELVFGDTLLVDAATAKQNFGKHRMVTLQGELYERGFITGGTTRGAMKFADAGKLAEEEKQLQKERTDAYAALEHIRMEMGRLRKAKITAEVRMKSMEIEIDSIMGKADEAAALRKRISESTAHLAKITSELEECNGSIGKLDEQKKLDEGIVAQFNELGTRVKVLENDLAHLNEALKFNRAEQNSMKNARAKALEAMKKLEKDKETWLSEAAQLEEKLSETRKDMDKLFQQNKELEATLTLHGVKLGKFRYERELLSKKQTELSIARASCETRLVDMKTELQGITEFEEIEGSKEELSAILKQCETEMNALGQVNPKAPQLYDEKAKSVVEIREKIDKLASEKSAVLAMIQEIDEKKYDIFMNAFMAINDKFQELCTRIFSDKCHLMLDKPMRPFESGLQIKVVQPDGKERMVEMFSGGEKALMALLLIFSIQLVKPSPFYIIDEGDAALDKENSKRFAELLVQLAERSQFVVITHNDTLIAKAMAAIGVSKTSLGSKIVSLELTTAQTLTTVTRKQ
ncbi:hypothetical protein COT30_04430 [Candidatus Micrarchaeota archaeon CG08_land_8_20_14_0_20_49_17]|nr:MAG: hypothetical protein COT30_04430 [Candidatus Micrarchaeota archaeon CG08_land_8_20_14_0_20_49_17]